VAQAADPSLPSRTVERPHPFVFCKRRVADPSIGVDLHSTFRNKMPRSLRSKGRESHCLEQRRFEAIRHSTVARARDKVQASGTLEALQARHVPAIVSAVSFPTSQKREDGAPRVVFWEERLYSPVNSSALGSKTINHSATR
jgi:hypothetical protein